MAASALFFALVVVMLVLLLFFRRIFLGSYLKWRLKKIKEWGRILDRIIARLGEPTPAELMELSVEGPFSRTILEEVLLERMDLMTGNSLIPLINVFQRSRLLNLNIRELEDRDVWKRRKAADKIARGAGRDYAWHLITALGDPDPDVRMIAAKGLGKMGIQVAAAPMVTQLGRLDDVRASVVVEAIVRLGPASLIALSRALEAEEEQLRHFASLAVAGICEEGRCRMQLIRKMPRRRITDLPLSFPRGLLPRLVRLTWDTSPRVRRNSVAALASLGVIQAAHRIEKLLARDPDEAVRVAAARALATLARTESATILLWALRDPAWSVQEAAAATLTELGAPWVERLDRDEFRGPRTAAWRREIEAGVSTWS